jgi:hypothetical protein
MSSLHNDDELPSAGTQNTQSSPLLHRRMPHCRTPLPSTPTPKGHRPSQEKSVSELRNEHHACLPSQQFRIEQTEERQRLAKLYGSLYGSHTHEYVEKLVRDRWKREGIWDDTWKEGEEAEWRWKHERTGFEFGSEHLFSITTLNLQDPSRPLSRFLNQVHQEIYKIWNEMMQLVLKAVDPTDYGLESHSVMGCSKAEATSHLRDQISTQASRIVKERWKRWDLWDDNWGELPGLAWKHELPMGEFPFHIYSPNTPGPSKPLAKYANMGFLSSGESSITSLNQSDVDSSLLLVPPPSKSPLPLSTPQGGSESEKISTEGIAIAVDIARRSLKRGPASEIITQNKPSLYQASPQTLRRSSRIIRSSPQCVQRTLRFIEDVVLDNSTKARATTFVLVRLVTEGMSTPIIILPHEVYTQSLPLITRSLNKSKN